MKISYCSHRQHSSCDVREKIPSLFWTKANNLPYFDPKSLSSTIGEQKTSYNIMRRKIFSQLFIRFIMVRISGLSFLIFCMAVCYLISMILGDFSFFWQIFWSLAGRSLSLLFCKIGFSGGLAFAIGLAVKAILTAGLFLCCRLVHPQKHTHLRASLPACNRQPMILSKIIWKYEKPKVGRAKTRMNCVRPWNKGIMLTM